MNEGKMGRMPQAAAEAKPDKQSDSRALYDFAMSEFNMFYDLNLMRKWKASMAEESPPAAAPLYFHAGCGRRT